MYDENGDFAAVVYDSHEKLDNGINIKKLTRKFEAVNPAEEKWIANVAIQEQATKEGVKPTFSIFQSNGKTREEALENLYKQVRNSLVADTQELFTLENRALRVAYWLTGQKVETG